jgi:hypothetical protein
MSPEGEGGLLLTCIYIDIASKRLILCFTNVEEERKKTVTHPNTRARSGKTTNTLAECKDYHNTTQELFDVASKEVNAAKT